jgi:hypothetical protein
VGTNGATFSSDTHNLALLIGERDEILDNLEVAETRYISSFKISTPDPSIADLDVLALSGSEETPSRPHIGRPRALVGSVIISVYCFISLGLTVTSRDTVHAIGDTTRHRLIRRSLLPRSWPHHSTTNYVA